MRFDIVTIFPGIFEGPFSTGLIARAQAKGLIVIEIHDLRDYTEDAHRTVDDLAYGGGGGMVLKPEPIFRAVEGISAVTQADRRGVVLLTPRGRHLDQTLIRTLSELEQLIVICGRYEGVDERVADSLVTHEVSLGDFVLSGGEIPAMALIEATSRMIPGVVGNPHCVEQDSFADYLLEHPHYTRPADFRGLRVPEVVLSGNHEEIKRYRKREALRMTFSRRPDLIREEELDEESRVTLDELKRGLDNGCHG